MRDYSRVSAKFWTGHTGREIREKGRDHQVLALYLLTSPQANMIGLYYLPLAYAVHETGIGASRIQAVMADLESVGFCRYDRDSEVVWVVNMARLQLGDAKASDKQRIGAARQYESAPASPLLGLFHDEYVDEIPFKSRREGLAKPLPSPSEDLPIQATAQHSTATSTARRRATSDEHSDGAERSAATASAPLASPAVIEIPTTKDPHPITTADIEEWKPAFPAVDVRQTLNHIRQWCLANPEKVKTPKGTRRFIVAWLTRDQDRGGSQGARQPQLVMSRKDQEIAASRAAVEEYNARIRSGQ